MPVRRNPVVRAGALLRKGGVHTTSATGKRQRSKLDLNNEIEEWLDDTNDDERADKKVTAKGRDSAPDGHRHLWCYRQSGLPLLFRISLH